MHGISIDRNLTQISGVDPARVAVIKLDIQGHEGAIMEGQDDAPLRGRFEGAYRATMNETVGGGSSEIQKNIIARRHLGLPKNF